MQEPKTKKAELTQRVRVGEREYGIGNVLFRHAVGARLGLSATDMECLGVVYFKGIAKPSELSRYTGLSPSATTAMLDRLERSGLIRRRPNPDDRRGVLIELVREGQAKVGPMFVSARRAQDEIVSHYSEAELGTIADFFERGVVMWEQELAKVKGRQRKGH
jgi:DNA-binding MarR family transcriptional regulator